MAPEQFVYWMQGFAELNESPPSPEQWRLIVDKLSLASECIMAHARHDEEIKRFRAEIAESLAMSEP